MADPRNLIRPNLREVEWLGIDRCRAIFEAGDGTRIETEFVVQRGEITTVAEEGSVLQRFNGTADEVRRVASTIIAFCDAAQLPPLSL